MKPKNLFLAGLMLVCCLSCGIADAQDEAHLEARAKIKRVQARKIALTKVPKGRPAGGHVEEREDGRLIWWFGITTADSPNRTDVEVDAMSGEIVSVDVMTPAALALEEQQEKLAVKAKISEAQAKKIALTKVPGGKAEPEIREEDGKLIWYLEVTTSSTKDRTDVAVDAMNGRIISVDVLTPEDQAWEKEQARLAAKAKFTEAQARKIALTKVPQGAADEGEIEEEDGKLVWYFGITTPGAKATNDVAVDAMTGAVISVEASQPETPAKEVAPDVKKVEKK